MNLRTASLADVGPAEIDELRQIGETLFVERKVTHKPVGDVLGPAVASMANTLGGWVLLGVEDDRGAQPGNVVGWEPKGRASAQDYLRDVLRGSVDPVPPFAAKIVEVDGGYGRRGARRRVGRRSARRRAVRVCVDAWPGRQGAGHVAP